MMTLDVTSWRYFLCAIAAFNIVTWSLLARLLNRRYAEIYRLAPEGALETIVDDWTGACCASIRTWKGVKAPRQVHGL